MTTQEIQAIKEIALAAAEIVKALEVLAGTKPAEGAPSPMTASNTKPQPRAMTAQERITKMMNR